jgi:ABC-2 type transport system ATP-binding protein
MMRKNPEETSVAEPLITAQQLRKRYGATTALDGVSFTIAAGRIVGLIGPNGAGKTTALKAVLGLIPYEGQLAVMGIDPYADRNALMARVSFIADVAVLPRWIRVQQVVDFVAGVHPQFRRDRCEQFLKKTNLQRDSRVKELSKGMVTQLHLALVMAIDAKLLVLDEPTLGLDIVSRKLFYDLLLNDYMDEERTILVTTHQIEEVEHVLTDVLFIDRGRIVVDSTMEALAERFAQVEVRADRLEAARALKPLGERQTLGRTVLLYENVPRDSLASLGEVRTPSVADVFVAKVQAGAAA